MATTAARSPERETRLVKERYWNNIVTSLRFQQCVLVLGPEICADGLPGAEPVPVSQALRDRLAAELGEDGVVVGPATTLSGVAQQYEDADGFGPATLRTQSAAFYEAARFAPSETHHRLAALPFSLVLSTSHDRLLAEALAAAGREPVCDRYDFRGDRQDNPELKIPGHAGSPFIYHLFGQSREPNSLVLSENDLIDFLLAVISGNPPLPNNLRRALQKQGTSFLFVGFGIRHWWLRVLLKVIVRGLSIGRTGGSSVAVEPLVPWVPEPERQQTILFYQRGTRIEVCDEELHPFMLELRRRFDEAGGAVARPEHALPIRPRVFVSYASEDEALATRLHAALLAAGFDPWLDKDALRAGSDWNRHIEETLREVDYVLVLQTAALADKSIGYVNKEIAIARDHALRFRGLSYLIPLVADDLPRDRRVGELASYHQLPLRDARFDDDVAQLVSTMRRDYQRRNARR